ncbi:hypothetical protein Pan181_09670 [Aeoliella mucimassa]|uniref:Uncharacterized protein n=1 Tax=Aeoliella mucimassa TaxID=2527972 RepID=A0A518AJD4_9BACT|nr:hypothetical protein Pan181_09670 [Aeoliella mucimassa]
MATSGVLMDRYRLVCFCTPVIGDGYGLTKCEENTISRLTCKRMEGAIPGREFDSGWRSLLRCLKPYELRSRSFGRQKILTVANQFKTLESEKKEPMPHQQSVGRSHHCPRPRRLKIDSHRWESILGNFAKGVDVTYCTPTTCTVAERPNQFSHSIVFWVNGNLFSPFAPRSVVVRRQSTPHRTRQASGFLFFGPQFQFFVKKVGCCNDSARGPVVSGGLAAKLSRLVELNSEYSTPVGERRLATTFPTYASQMLGALDVV